MPDLPDNIGALKTALAAAERRADLAEADAAHAEVKASGIEALVAHLTLQIEVLRRELYGTRSERTARLLDQLEMQLEDAEAALTKDELAAEAAAAKTTAVASFERRRRDVGGDPAPVEGDPNGTRQVQLPGLREDQPGAGTVPPDPARVPRPHPWRLPKERLARIRGGRSKIALSKEHPDCSGSALAGSRRRARYRRPRFFLPQ